MDEKLVKEDEKQEQLEKVKSNKTEKNIKEPFTSLFNRNNGISRNQCIKCIETKLARLIVNC